MSPLLGEIIGTFLLILLGNGVVANVLLKNSKGENGGWLLINFGWAIAVFIAVFIVAPYSGAHLNPAVTIGLAVAGKFAWSKVVMYIIAQFIGAFLGAVFVWIQYKDHYAITQDEGAILASFSTGPAIRNSLSNVVSEIIGTFVLVFAVLYITSPTFGDTSGSLGSLDALPVALVVLGIGISLGGTTGYAINPARDLGPRFAHAILPVSNKGGSDWTYAWVPLVGPIIGGGIAGALFLALAG